MSFYGNVVGRGKNMSFNFDFSGWEHIKVGSRGCGCSSPEVPFIYDTGLSAAQDLCHLYAVCCALKSNICILKGELEKLPEYIEKLISDKLREEIDERWEQLKEELTAELQVIINAEIQPLINRITALETSIADLTAKVQKNEGDITALNAEITAVKTQITSLTSDITTLQEKVATLETNINNLTSQINAVKTQITELDEKVTTLEGQIAGFDADITKLKTEVSENTNNITALLTTVGNINDSIGSILNRLAVIEGNLGSTIATVRDHTSSINNLSSQYTTLNRAVTDLTSDVGSLKSKAIIRLGSYVTNATLWTIPDNIIARAKMVVIEARNWISSSQYRIVEKVIWLESGVGTNVTQIYDSDIPFKHFLPNTNRWEMTARCASIVQNSITILNAYIYENGVFREAEDINNRVFAPTMRISIYGVTQ